MKMLGKLKTYRELQLLATNLECQYAAALDDEDPRHRIEACGGLSIVYSAMGNGSLSRKWAEQYLEHLMMGSK